MTPISDDVRGDQHTIHRIEAFTDIVMGFCLAQIGVSLVMPKGGFDTATVWMNVQLFLVSFFFIVVLWWLHHRIFKTYFVLNSFTLALNFTMLGSLVMTMYFLQIGLHVAAANGDAAPFLRCFAISFACAYGLLGGMLVYGLLSRRRELSLRDLQWGAQRASTFAIAVVFFVYAGSLGQQYGHFLAVRMNLAGLTLFVAAMVFARLAVPFLVKLAFVKSQPS